MGARHARTTLCLRGALVKSTVAIGVIAAVVVGFSQVGSVRRAHASRVHHPFLATQPASAVDSSIGDALPELPGPPPYPVGVVHVSYTDSSRSTAAHGDIPELPNRTLRVTIRYPAIGAPSAGETEGAPSTGAFPLLVFAHGYDTSADTYATLEHQLAAVGFVVAAPDFPLTSSGGTDSPDRSDIVNQPGDVSFVITQLLDPWTVPDALRGDIATTKVGVIGHSDGGITAAAVTANTCCADPRIGAAAILSGAESAFAGDWFTTTSAPFLIVQGTTDEINGFDASTQLFNDAQGPKYLVAVPGGSHLGPFTTDPTEPQIATLIADFMQTTLSSDPSATGRLPGDMNVDGTLTLLESG